MFRRNITFFLVIYFPTISMAAEWWAIGTPPSHDKVYFLDMESIQKNSESITSAQVQVVNTKHDYQIREWSFSCSTKESGLKVITNYDSDGSVKKSKVFPAISYEPSIPGTLSYTLLNVVCADAPRAQANPDFQFRLKEGVRPIDIATEFFDYMEKRHPKEDNMSAPR